MIDSVRGIACVCDGLEGFVVTRAWDTITCILYNEDDTFSLVNKKPHEIAFTGVQKGGEPKKKSVKKTTKKK